MNRDHGKIFCFFLTIFLFFSGVYPEAVQAHSFLDCMETAANMARIDRRGGEISEIPACTGQMLGVRKLCAPQVDRQAASGMEKKAARLLVLCLFLSLMSFFFFCFYWTACGGQFLKLRRTAAILDYIHGMDGKK